MITKEQNLVLSNKDYEIQAICSMNVVQSKTKRMKQVDRRTLVKSKVF